MKKLALTLTVLALAALGLAACGDDDEDTTTSAATTESTATTDSGGGEGGAVAITADSGGALAFEETEATVPAGEVTIDFDNPASLPHDVVVEDADGNELIRTDVVTGDTTSASGPIEAGEYTFYCSVDSHREAGMEGTLTVE